MSMIWTVDPRSFMTTVNASLAAKTKELAEEIFDGVVERSPVFTGSFRASWKVTVNTIDTSEVIGGIPGHPLRPPRFPTIAVSNGDIVYVTNNRPYGKKLEYGHSSQAPNGVVGLTIASL